MLLHVVSIKRISNWCSSLFRIVSCRMCVCVSCCNWQTAELLKNTQAEVDDAMINCYSLVAFHLHQFPIRWNGSSHFLIFLNYSHHEIYMRSAVIFSNGCVFVSTGSRENANYERRGKRGREEKNWNWLISLIWSFYSIKSI